MLTEWAGQCYRELEAQREECEKEGKPSIFELAFVDTGCMIADADSMSGDDKIKELKKIQNNLTSCKSQVTNNFWPGSYMTIHARL